MPKDARGITIKEGDEIYYNGSVITVTGIKESGLVGASAIVGGKSVAQPLPSIIEGDIVISYDARAPISNVLILGKPKDVDLLEQKNKRLGVN